MNLDDVVKEFSEYAYAGSAAFFIGSGISVPSSLPDWGNLLEPFVSDLNIKIRSDDDLPAIAQYVVNYHSGNKGALVRRVMDRLRLANVLNPYHLAIARSAVDLIWTTNFDGLLEAAFPPARINVRRRDSDLTSPFNAEKVELVKMHGCITGSVDEIVLTKEDYEDYCIKQPAIVERLRSDLLRRHFLFCGYSYSDPNIRNIVVEARRLSKGAPLRHFMIQLEETTKGLEERYRQKLWAADLRRIGIDCVFIDSYSQLTDALERISLASRGPTVYVTGSHVAHPPLAEELGAELAELRHLVLMDGQSEGTARRVLAAFQETAISKKIDIKDRVRSFANPYAWNPAISNDPALLPVLRQWRSALLRRTNIVVAFDGRMGTEAEVETALQEGCRVVPVPGVAGGSSERFLKDPRVEQPLQRYAPDYLAAAQTGRVTAKEIASCLFRGLPR